MNFRKRSILVLLGLSLITLFGGVSLDAQVAKKAAELRAKFSAHSIEVCYVKDARFKVGVKVDNPYPASSKILCWYSRDDGSEANSIHTVPQGIDEIELDIRIPEIDGIHKQIPIILKRIYIGDDKTGADTSKMDFYNDEPDTLLLDVYKYPVPKLLCDMIYGEGRLCSLDTVLMAEHIDGDEYRWNVVVDKDMLRSEAVGSNYFVKSAGPRTLKVDLVQSRGPECASKPLTAIVKMYTSPKGYIENVDESGSPEPLRVCSIIDDPAAHFTSSAELVGDYPPFKLKLTNKAEIIGLPEGRSSINLYQPTAFDIAIAYVSDANGCHSKPVDVSGVINVIDRTPVCYFPQDTVDVTVSRNGRYFNIAVEGYTEGNETKWSVPDDYKDVMGKYGLMIIDRVNDYTAKLTSTINVKFPLDYKEINHDGEECMVTKRVFINPTIEFYLPSAISPNGDGVNDVLIIEGLSDFNEFHVFDMKGKLVYEETNYRNNWSADDLEDGHYVYVIETGGKTYKQVLAIKRTSNN